MQDRLTLSSILREPMRELPQVRIPIVSHTRVGSTQPPDRVHSESRPIPCIDTRLTCFPHTHQSDCQLV